MYLFLPTFSSDHPPIGSEGLSSPAPMRLYASLAEAEAAGVTPGGRLGRILVLDEELLTLDDGPDGPTVRSVPRAAVANLDRRKKLWRPLAVEAAGGLVLTDSPKGPRVLMIHRRGVWDLPKGKLDPGETPAEAALREVAEEVGIAREALSLVGEIPPTVHGYAWPRKNVFAVKTTHWFHMRTTATAFTPEAAEKIDKVKWKRWPKALKQVGFKTLRELLRTVNPEAELAAHPAPALPEGA